MPADATGEQIFAAACATCHAADGTGSPKSVVGFTPLANGHDLPDFTDCAINTVEPLPDWVAVVHEGGPIRALDRHMPAFGDALTLEQIERAVKYLWSFCDDASWPRGDLNFPRAFFTEKAFPGERDRDHDRRDDERAEERHEPDRLRAPHRIARPVRNRGADRHAAGRGGRFLEPRARRYRGRGPAHLLSQRRARQHLRRRRRRRAADRQGRTRPRQRLHHRRAVRDVRPDVRRHGFLQVHAGIEIPDRSRHGRERRRSCARRSATRSRRIAASAGRGRRCWKC